MIWVKTESVQAVLKALTSLGTDEGCSEAAIADYTELPQPEVRAALHSIVIMGIPDGFGGYPESLDRNLQVFLEPYRRLPFPFI